LAIQALADGRRVAKQRGVVRVLAVIAALVVPGCFYVEPINQRPSIDIRQQSSDEVYRGSDVVLEAVDNDPEGQLVLFNWRAYVCDDASDQATCDATPFYTGDLGDATFTVPAMRVDAPIVVQSILVILQARDDHGAIARPDSRLIIPVSNHAPIVTMSMSAPYALIVGHPVNVYASVSDEDDEPVTNLTIAWNVYRPMDQPDYTFDDITAPGDQFGKQLVPQGLGDWQVNVVVTDPLGAQATTSEMFKIIPDDPPCLTQWSPIVAPAGEALPISDPTLFQVLVVKDTLDPYPLDAGDPARGVTSFAWSIKQPGASTRTPLATTGNSVPFDPSSYAPGDIVELRVEIADRVNTAVSCDEDLPTCSATPSCNQRLTWRVEVR
jgi:hypothetical protein